MGSLAVDLDVYAKSSSLTLEWVKLNTSNLVHRLTMASTIRGYYSKRERGQGSLKNFGPPIITLELLKLDTHLV